MTEAIGIRLENEFLRIIDKLGKEEIADRSTMLRKLLKIGFADYMKQKAKEKYITGRCTFSEAAKIANCTIWEMQKYLIDCGYKSEYSIKDLEEDMKQLE